MGILEERGEGKERVIGKMKEREKERGVALNGIHYCTTCTLALL